ERAAARHDVAHDRDVLPRHLLEEEDRIAATPLVLEHERHHVLLERDLIPHADHLAGVGSFIGGSEAPQVLAGPGKRAYPRPAQKAKCVSTPLTSPLSGENCPLGEWPLKYSSRIWSFRVSSTPSISIPARAEMSAVQLFSSRCCTSPAATGRHRDARDGHGLL